MFKRFYFKLLHNPLIRGTAILTIAGFITRVIGFFYKIILSKYLGTENLGVYQLIFPIYGICFTIYASGLQTSISKLTADARYKTTNKPLKTGLFISLLLSLSLSILISTFSEQISTTILHEPKCMYPLKVLSTVFPFCGATACINGYYYGHKKAAIPAITQLLEQIIRVSFIFVYVSLCQTNKLSCEMAVFGLVLGELSSCILNVISIKINENKTAPNPSNTFPVFKELVEISVPLTSNRLLLSVLSSIESILIPYMLQIHGLTNESALSVYGILTGMAMSFILFPSAITNSLSVLLLPTISEADSKGNNNAIKSTTAKTIHYCLLIGILSIGLFITFGYDLGAIIFNNSTAGRYITILAWLCPFLYLSSTLSSILNGLGKAHLTFINSIIGAVIRISFTIILIPEHGIYGYFLGMLVSSVMISLLDIIAVRIHVKFQFNALHSIIRPGIIVLITSTLVYNIYKFASVELAITGLSLLFTGCLLYIGIFLFFICLKIL